MEPEEADDEFWAAAAEANDGGGGRKADDDDGGGGGGDDDGEKEDAIEVANRYYAAKEERDAERASALLRAVEAADAALAAPGRWTFRARKRRAKQLARGRRWGALAAAWRELLASAEASHVAPSEAERGLLAALAAVAPPLAADAADARAAQRGLLEALLAHLRRAPNERLWFRAQLRLGAVLLADGAPAAALRVCRELHESLRPPADAAAAGAVAVLRNRESRLLDVYALELQAHADLMNSSQLDVVYRAAVQVKAAIPSPRILGVVHECGGKLLLDDRRYDAAYQALFESFRQYAEAGDPRRVRVLRYLVLAGMLSGSAVDVFDAPETLAYAAHPDVAPLRALRRCYAADDARGFEATLGAHRDALLADPFVRGKLQTLAALIRRRGLLRALRPFRRVSLEDLAERLRVPLPDVAELLQTLILDGEISGRIDQARWELLLHSHDAPPLDVLAPAAPWAEALACAVRVQLPVSEYPLIRSSSLS